MFTLLNTAGMVLLSGMFKDVDVNVARFTSFGARNPSKVSVTAGSKVVNSEVHVWGSMACINN